MIRKMFALALVAAPLAACAPAPAAVEPLPVMEVPAVTGVSGLQERQPDGCHAGTYVSALGQPGSVIRTLGITRDYRVVEHRGIEPQEYDPLRIVFRLDQMGNIQNIDCG
ncbi:hypothetical protein KTN05_02665 [Paracoccus sp. Z118]|uniref:hypothetical protein n=1 Tax=Paracoccus sp. Z118 TaxID=2851017 RepID=UPI001C2C5AE3|nr:hypothetical protein [Paracoccus sp. Z118]MBV0890751.1 hypothetical protein [Paracoccus sp. Z118]